MRYFSKLILSTFTVGTLFLTGCQHASIKKNLSTPLTESQNQFSLQGKIGVKTPQQSGSAFFTWQQQQDQFDIELSGILGVGKTQITGQTGEVSLTSAKTGTITAETPEELLEQATGWQAPITHLVKWVQAMPATQQAQILNDENKRPIQFIENDWTVDLSYKDAAKLPNKLILKQKLESGEENRITMIIQNR